MNLKHYFYKLIKQITKFELIKMKSQAKKKKEKECISIYNMNKKKNNFFEMFNF